MKDLKSLFLPYELAKIAKEKGFNEPCCAYYLKSDKSLNFSFNASNDEYTDCLAPLCQQIVDWFREEKDIHITNDVNLRMDGSLSGYLYRVYYQNSKGLKSYDKTFSCADPSDVINKVIEEAFKLI